MNSSMESISKFIMIYHCVKKQNILMEYYKKREQWTDVSSDDLESEYKACINMLNYIHCIMLVESNKTRIIMPVKHLLNQIWYRLTMVMKTT